MNQQYVYGRNPVIELLKKGKVQKLYMQKGADKGSIRKIYSMAKEKNIVISQYDKLKLDEMVNKGNHQGVVALISSFEYSNIEDILTLAKKRKEDPKIILLDSIEDPHNLGAIARSAEAAGFHGIILPKRRSALVNDTVYKASAGAIENILVAVVTNLSTTILELKEKGIWVYGADMEGKEYYSTDLTGPLALVIGNEGKGIGHGIKKNCDGLIRISMKGQIESLNASCASSILIFEVLRQENEKIQR